ncbi:MAG: AAA family ATPase [Nitrososphaerota archaeon]
MRRIHVVGTSGSGKTTFAHRIAERLNMQHVELDALHWQPGWTPTETDVLRARIAQEISGDGWVVDGNYSALRDIIWARADTVIWLDYTLPVVCWRIISRTTRRMISRTELWNGNRESLRSVFSRDSIVLWALSTWGKNRHRYDAFFSHPGDYAHIQFIHLRSPGETRIWLQQLAAPQSLPVH